MLHPTSLLFVIAGLTLAAPSPTTVWQPAVGSLWQIILRTRIDTSTTIVPDVPVWDIDGESHTAQEIQVFKDQGKNVICYFSAGTFEPNRTDSAALAKYTGNSLAPEWPEEHWLKTNEKEVRDVMADRISKLAAKGCNAIDPDNMDGYGADNGLNLTEADALDYINFLSTEAKKYGLSTGLKNAAAIAKPAIAAGAVHFSIQEQCDEKEECDLYDEFIKNGLPVFNIEYVDAVNRTHPVGCPKNAGFSTVIKNMALDGWVQMCDGTQANTTTLSSFHGH